MNKPLLKEQVDTAAVSKIQVISPTECFSDESPYERFLGIEIDEESGAQVYRMSFREQHVGNPLIKTFHGGILASFAEVVAARHLQASGEIAYPPKCTSTTFDYLRPAFAGTLCAEPQTVRAGKRFVTVAVDVFLEQSLVCRGRFIYSRAAEKA